MADTTKTLPGKVDPNEALADMARKLAEAEAALASLKAKGHGRISCKVSEKGCLSVYGLGRFPVTLYAGQWERLLSDSTVATIRQAIADNAGKLARKE